MRRVCLLLMVALVLCAGACEGEKAAPAAGASPPATEPAKVNVAPAGDAANVAPAPAADTHASGTTAPPVGASAEDLDTAVSEDATASGLPVAPVDWDVEKTGVQPLPEAMRAVFWGSPEDPPTEEFLGVDDAHVGKRYLQGDEYALHLYYEHIKGFARGGSYVGVGSDQAYVFVGWTEPDLAFLIDYDPWVVEYHKVFHAFFRAAETPKAFLAYWQKDHADAVNALLKKEYADDPNLKLLMKLYKRQRSLTARRFSHYKTFAERKVPTFVTDQAQYDFVRAMIMAGRVRPLSANLLADKGLLGIGAVSRELGVPVRAFYTSNAEQYWNYSEQFRDNVRGLYHDDKSMVIRTLGSVSHNKDYRYYLHPIDNFVKWMDKKKIYKAYCPNAQGCSVYRMTDRGVGRRKLEGEGDFDLQIFSKEPPSNWE